MAAVSNETSLARDYQRELMVVVATVLLPSKLYEDRGAVDRDPV